MVIYEEHSFRISLYHPVEGAQHLKNKNWLDRQNMYRVSQERIGPLILETSQMYILNRVNLLCTLCYEMLCSQ